MDNINLSTMSSNKATLLFSFLLILIFGFYYHDLIFRLPSGIHQWAQGDRLALAYGFLDNGLNLFKPATFSQFSVNGIVGVEFPIQAYITALLSSVVGREYVSFIYRLLDVVVIGTCLVFFFKVCYIHTRRFVLAVIPPSFLLFSPCFVDYTCSYMPDTFSTSLAIVGICHYILFVNQPSKTRWLWTMLFVTLATLIKTSTGTYLIGILAFEFLRSFKLIRERRNYAMINRLLISSVISLGIVLAYYFYNKHLNAVYKSDLFLAESRPFTLDTFKYFVGSRFHEVWMKEYFIIPAYGYFLLLGVMAYYSPKSSFVNKLSPLIFIFSAGTVFVFYKMGSQFIDHDYYVIPIFFPLIAFGLFLFIVKISNVNYTRQNQLKRLNIGLAVLSSMLIVLSQIQVSQRISSDYPGFSNDYMTDWLEGGEMFLDKQGVDKKEFITVIYENAPNLSLVYFDRKGYVLAKGAFNDQFNEIADFMKSKNTRLGLIKTSNLEKMKTLDTSFDQYFEIVAQHDAKTRVKLKN